MEDQMQQFVVSLVVLWVLWCDASQPWLLSEAIMNSGTKTAHILNVWIQIISSPIVYNSGCLISEVLFSLCSTKAWLLVARIASTLGKL